MFHIFNKPFSEIGYTDILYLKESNIREEQCLDYKRQLDKDDIAHDACAMANAEGGYIIIGIAEGENQDEGYPTDIISVKDPQRDELCIREKLKDLINPPLRFETKIIRTDDFKDIILVSIPNSIQKPHYVSKSKKGGPFPVRINRTTSYWSMGDIHNQILARFNVHERIERKINDLVQNNPLKNPDRPILSLLCFPEFFGKEIINVSDKTLREMIETNQLPPELQSAQDEWNQISYFTFGLQGTNMPSNIDHRKCLRLHRDGTFEVHHLLPLCQSNSDQLGTELNPYILKDDIKKFFYKITQIYDHLSFYDPITIHYDFRGLLPKYRYEKIGRLNLICLEAGFTVSYDSMFQEGIQDDFLSRFYNSLGIDDLPD